LQLNKIVRGVAPIRPLYEVGRATAQLLVLPAEQYKKDKRLLKGLRKGELRGRASACLPFVVSFILFE
jgi:autophagy-related protein 2